MGVLVAKAIFAGVLLASLAACIGCMVQWRRMAFVSDALAHSSLLGIGLSLLLGVNLYIGLIAVMLALALAMHLLGDQRLPNDSVLALLAHLSLAGGTVMLIASGNTINWESLLFGNILTISNTNLYLLISTSILLAVLLTRLWPALVTLATIPDIAVVELRHRRWINLLFLLFLCLYVAVGVRLVGVLLLNALLVIPAATARQLASTPGQMIAYATGVGVVCIVAGITASFIWDVPAAPACVLATGALFTGACLVSAWHKR